MRIATTLALALILTACAKGPTAAAPDPSAEGRAFLSKNAHAPGVIVTKDGLQYRILHSGPAIGLKPKLADEVKVDYEAKLLDGQVVDSSYERGQPAVMTVRDLVPGWQEALQLMRPGDEWLIYLPPKLGYGDKGAGPIPPGAVLTFKLDLIAVMPDQSSVGRG
ncbi:MAG TPA: FKBP-type peptidyl-prolyl cis-trans isomerase [Caulobacteraceae bacterium]|jgi:peptidylprolyl isomerase/FKBP-type peptidyl-prolyl cis-trans isomerase FklB|nr:FKBP-type peptidyl-prolyl cis-trans isomerase [Caulobacteraceae bacterium]